MSQAGSTKKASGFFARHLVAWVWLRGKPTQLVDRYFADRPVVMIDCAIPSGLVSAKYLNGILQCIDARKA